MNTKNDVEVVINGRKYKLCGYESDAYLQSVAAYLNQKYDSFKDMENYNRMDSDLRSVLLEINIADDYFKAKSQVERLEEDAKKKNNELFNLKHDMIHMQSKVDMVLRDMQALKFENIESQKKIVKLETELAESKRREKEILRERSTENPNRAKENIEGPRETNLSGALREQAQRRPAQAAADIQEDNAPEEPKGGQLPAPDQLTPEGQNKTVTAEAAEQESAVAAETEEAFHHAGKEDLPGTESEVSHPGRADEKTEETHRFMVHRNSRRPRRAYIDGWKPEWKL